jgi:hypothetical protein
MAGPCLLQACVVDDYQEKKWHGFTQNHRTDTNISNSSNDKYLKYFESHISFYYTISDKNRLRSPDCGIPYLSLVVDRHVALVIAFHRIFYNAVASRRN